VEEQRYENDLPILKSRDCGIVLYDRKLVKLLTLRNKAFFVYGRHGFKVNSIDRLFFSNSTNIRR